MLMIGQAISQSRLRKGLTQSRLAAACGIPQSNLSNIEKGKKDLTVFTLIRIASALDVKPAQFFEEGLEEKAGFELTRSKIEALAEAIVNPHLKTSAETRRLASLFREILMEAHPRRSSKKINAAWIELKKRFTSQEIAGIRQRVQDAAQRKQ